MIIILLMNDTTVQNKKLKKKWITNKDLLYSTWISAQCYVAVLIVAEFVRRMDPCICMAESLCCPPEITVLLTGYQFSSVAQLCPTLCNPMNRSTPGLPVHHKLPEFTQTHVHQVGDAIQTSHPLSSPSPPAPNPSQHQSLFQ